MTQLSLGFPAMDQPIRLLTIKEVMQFTSLSKAQINRMVANREFPAPLKISKRRCVWCPTQIGQWLDNHKAVATETARTR
jgi:prophage regulatory protein